MKSKLLLYDAHLAGRRRAAARGLPADEETGEPDYTSNQQNSAGCHGFFSVVYKGRRPSGGQRFDTGGVFRTRRAYFNGDAFSGGTFLLLSG